MTDSAYFRAAVGAFILNDKNQLLLVLKHGYGDRWDIPKGGINRGESDLEALGRELKEELELVDYQIIEKSKLSLVKVKYKVDWNTTEHIGQAWNNYWLRVNQSTFSVPNEEIERTMWMDVTKENIRKYFNVHDDEGFLETLLPIEFERITNQL